MPIFPGTELTRLLTREDIGIDTMGLALDTSLLILIFSASRKETATRTAGCEWPRFHTVMRTRK